MKVKVIPKFEQLNKQNMNVFELTIFIDFLPIYIN